MVLVLHKDLECIEDLRYGTSYILSSEVYRVHIKIRPRCNRLLTRD